MYMYIYIYIIYIYYEYLKYNIEFSSDANDDSGNFSSGSDLIRYRNSRGSTRTPTLLVTIILIHNIIYISRDYITDIIPWIYIFGGKRKKKRVGEREKIIYIYKSI